MSQKLQHSRHAQIVTNHVGYELDGRKKAVVVSDTKIDIEKFELVHHKTHETVLEGPVVYSGPVDAWKNFLFYEIDFSAHSKTGTYYLQIVAGDETISSYPFSIAREVLEQFTLSDVVYYFKGQRSSGAIDQADRQLRSPEHEGRALDLHGGWYDATGDYGKHLSLLTFSTYFNPQQIPLTVWSLLKTYQLLNAKEGRNYIQRKRRVLDEAMYGADYLVRVHKPGGSFYRSVYAQGKEKLAQDRIIDKESVGFQVKETEEQSWALKSTSTDIKSYQVSFRSGGGMAIAALAMAAAQETRGDFSSADYIKAAEDAFAFLQAHNISMTNDGTENIVDDYCALEAAVALYAATKNVLYKKAADERAARLLQRLIFSDEYGHYWRADEADRPFFHPTDAGLPVISLINYLRITDDAANAAADASMGTAVKNAIKQSLLSELQRTAEVNNPFGYSRQLVQEATTKNRKTVFFFSHDTEVSPWWQGENGRLGSMAAAARAASRLFADDAEFCAALQKFAADQLNWILGLNPFDTCMLQGRGHNNPAYGFFGTFEYVNAPGGIVNGITSGIDDEHDIAFNIPYSVTGKDYDWRWAEQWLPHASWYMYAVALGAFNK